MRASRIDFANRSLLRTVLEVRLASWLALVAGIIACTSAGMMAYSLLSQDEARQLEMQRLQKRQQARAQPTAPQAETISVLQAKAVNEIVSRLNLPWHDVFQSIEAATPVTIALLELTPDAERHALKGMAEAKTSDDMLAYIARLGEQPFFSSVQLIRHEFNEQDPNKPIRFQFTAEWGGNAK
jgi:Tfp pilus assembly protein PilN